MKHKFDLQMRVQISGAENGREFIDGTKGIILEHNDHYDTWKVVFDVEVSEKYSGRPITYAWFRANEMVPENYDPTKAEVVVLRVEDIDRAKEFFDGMGLTFVREQHENGPEHWACEREGKVFEIYPIGQKTAGLEYR